MQLSLNIDHETAQPLYARISDALKQAIENGALRPGQTVPSARSLAQDLAVSRLTTRKAYDLLNRQGYLETCMRGKTFVSKSAPIEEQAEELINFCPDDVEADGNSRLSRYGKNLVSASRSAFHTHLSGLTSQDLIPERRWRACLREAASSFAEGEFNCSEDSFGSIALRKELEQFLLRVRRVKCHVEQIVVLPSREDGINLLSRILLDPGDEAAVEEPCHPGIRENLLLNDARILPVSVDDEGISVEELRQLSVPPKIVRVTPVQDTTHVRMSRDRRRELVDWVANSGSIVLEEDKDWEFSFAKHNDSALHPTLPAAQAIYLYNFRRALFPLARLSIMVIPKWLIPVFRIALASTQTQVSELEQNALYLFIKRGFLDKHIRNCKSVFAARRANLILNLTKALGKAVSFGNHPGGTHLVVKFAESFAEEEIERASSVAGLELNSQADHYYSTRRPRNQYVICFSNADESVMSEKVSEFSRILLANSQFPEQFFSHLLPGMSTYEMRMIDIFGNSGQSIA